MQAWSLTLVGASALPAAAQGFPPPQPPAGAPAFNMPASYPAVPDSVPRFPGPSPTVGSEVFEPGLIVARVGNQYIFKGDLQGEANVILAPLLEKMSDQEKAIQAGQIEAERERITQQLLEGAIQRKLLYLDFMRQADKVPDDKRKEMFAKIQKSTDEFFSKNLESMQEKVKGATQEDLAELFQQELQLTRLALAMKQRQLVSEQELDRYLRELGSSLQQQRQIYMERMVGNEARRKEMNPNVEISHEAMLQFYRDHIGDYLIPAKVRWEQLSAYFDKFPDKYSAGEAIKQMGNEAYLGGVFAPVAKRSSQEPNAEDGGYHDWLSQGSLKSKVLENALFTLPAGQMSPILEDETGLHIVRVLERKEAHTVPFLEAQVEIKEKLRQESLKQQHEQYIEMLRKTIPVWTVDDPAP